MTWPFELPVGSVWSSSAHVPPWRTRLSDQAIRRVFETEAAGYPWPDDSYGAYSVAMDLVDGLLRLHSPSVPVEDFLTDACGWLFRYHPKFCLH
jgi:hypothetical protein